MGGYNSGRWGGQPTADLSKRIDIAWLVRTGRAQPGAKRWGTLSWNIGSEPAGSISYEADMRDLEAAELRLSYTRNSDGPALEHVRQTISLVYTKPHYGGRRWWAICPYSGRRAGKLYLPAGGDRFAGRKAWRLGYQSQRGAHYDRPFNALFRIQKKLGCEQGVDNWPRRPKGMHRRTYERHMARYDELDDQCAAALWGMVSRLSK